MIVHLLVLAILINIGSSLPMLLTHLRNEISNRFSLSLHCVETKTPPEESSLPRVYKPKSTFKPQNIENARSTSGAPYVLLSPQMLIRYRVPKVKSKLKTQLEELQVIEETVNEHLLQD